MNLCPRPQSELLSQPGLEIRSPGCRRFFLASLCALETLYSVWSSNTTFLTSFFCIKGKVSDSMNPSHTFLPSLLTHRKGSLPGVGGICRELVLGSQSGYSMVCLTCNFLDSETSPLWVDFSFMRVGIHCL